MSDAPNPPVSADWTGGLGLQVTVGTLLPTLLASSGLMEMRAKASSSATRGLRRPTKG